jgi:hypothetical protein
MNLHSDKMVKGKKIFCAPHIRNARGIYLIQRVFITISGEWVSARQESIVRRRHCPDIVAVLIASKKTGRCVCIRHYYAAYRKKRLLFAAAWHRRGQGSGRNLPGGGHSCERYGVFDESSILKFPWKPSRPTCKEDAVCRRPAAEHHYCIHICEGCLNNCTYCDYKAIRKSVVSKNRLPPSSRIFAKGSGRP